MGTELVGSTARNIHVPDAAKTSGLGSAVTRLLPGLERFLAFPEADRAVADRATWMAALDRTLPAMGAGLDGVVDDLERWVVPYGLRTPHPGFSGYIIGRATTASIAAGLAAQVAGHVRYFLTPFTFLEQLSLDWLAELCGIRPGSSGVYSGGGSTANLLALGAARQAAFEAIGVDPAADGIPGHLRSRIYGSSEVHHTIQRAAGVLGLGRRAFTPCDTDTAGRVDPAALSRQLRADRADGVVPIAVVAVAGTTGTGAIDPIDQLADVAAEHGVWLHVDGAYGLPARCLPELADAYRGVERADSAIVDPHKWLGTPAGCGVTYVRDGDLLERAFTQEPAAYLETFAAEEARSQFDSPGPHWFDRSLELTSPSRGVWVWATLLEIGLEGVRARISRHVGFAEHLGAAALAHPRLELLVPPSLSICCFRYRSPGTAEDDLGRLNEEIIRRLRAETRFVTSTTVVDGKLAIRPCFVNAATTLADVDGLAEAVVAIGDELSSPGGSDGMTRAPLAGAANR